MFTEEDDMVVVPLIIKTETNFEQVKIAKTYSIFQLSKNSVFLKIAAQASEAGDFFNIYLRFLGF